MPRDMKVFAGNANRDLAIATCQHLGLPLSKAVVSRFSDQEIKVEIQENVRGKDVFIVQSTSAPTNDHLMEILLMADALRRASAKRITAVIPYFGYARQDRRVRSARVPISAKVVADMLTCAGINRIVTLDLHADQIQGFFDLPVDNIYASSVVLLAEIQRRNYSNMTVVSPDVGGVVRARAIAKRLDDTDLAIIDKRRPEPNKSEVMHIIGDVKDRTCIIVDDLVDTAGTLCQAADALKVHGATQVVAFCTHPVLSGNAIANIEKSVLDLLVVTNTIALRSEQTCAKIQQIDLAELLSETIRRVNVEESLSLIFDEDTLKTVN